MYIANYNNCWFTNVGEGFIDIGVQYLFTKLQKRCPEIRFGTLSSMSQYYLRNIRGYNSYSMVNLDEMQRKAESHGVLLRDYFCPDLYLFPGMFASDRFSEETCVSRQFGEYINEHGGRVAFIGLGAEKYTDDERRNFLNSIKKLNPLFIITRDKKTYEMYYNYVECKKGLDCAFWVNDGFNPKGIKHKSYVISTFNRSDEPLNIATHLEYIHPWHMQYTLTIEKTRYLAKKNLMISDSPFDYITWYANAEKVSTDLVHATIISLLYGTPVKYYQIDSRKDAFESLSYITTDDQGFMRLDIEKLEEEKKAIEQYILMRLNEIK